MGHHRLKAAAGASPADPYFSSTSLLLLGNGTNGGQNNTFVDSSTNNFTVQRNGNTTQGSFSPFSAPDGRWSNYFDGSGDYLTGPSNSAFSFGTSDFTAECWVYFTSLPTANQSLFDFRNGSDNSSFFMGVYSNNIPFFANQSGGVLNGSFTFNVNTWYHIAYTRSGTSLNIWVNGTNVGTTTNSTNLTGTNCKIGADSSGAYNVFGYISNARVIKGTALYTANFTPSTSPLTAIANTSLLTCQSNRFIDNSSNAFTITPSGNAAVTPFSPFAPLAEYSAGSNGGSGYFDGSGDYLSIGSASQTEFNFGSPSGSTNNFTIEGWFYSTGSLNSSNNQLLVGVHDNATCGSWGVYVRSDGVFIFGSGCTFTGGGTISSGTWYHFAIVRSGSTLTVYVNGQQVDQQTRTGDYENSGDTLGVGRQVANGNYAFTGYISNLRILKGTAQYTATFTPPTSPLTAITNTSLLLNFTNASIIDSTAKNDLETVGDAQVSTSVKKFGTGSMKFDGTANNRLVMASTSNLLLGSGDFTVELWLYKNTSKTYMVACGNLLNANSSAWQILHDVTGNKIAWYSSFAFQLTSTTTLATSTWYHVAFVRSGTSFKLYLNGTQEASTTNSVDFNVTNPLWVGHAPENTAGRDWDGYIDDLRITKGVARYTSNFTPPAAQLPAR